MRYQNLKSLSFCVGSLRQQSACISFESDITKLCQNFKLVSVFDVIVKSQRFLMITQNKLKVWVTSLRSFRRSSAKGVKISATGVLKNIGRALEIGTKIGSAAVSKEFTGALSKSPVVKKICHTRNGLHLGKFV